MELAEKLEQAFAAYLQGIGSFNGINVVPGENDADKTKQTVVCAALDHGDEDPPFSGNRVIHFLVEIRTPVALPSTLASHKTLADALEKALVVPGLSDLVNAAAAAKAIADPANSADLANFCLYPVTQRVPHREQREELWASGATMPCYCMGNAG